jgi:hypothetical protein
MSSTIDISGNGTNYVNSLDISGNISITPFTVTGTNIIFTNSGIVLGGGGSAGTNGTGGNGGHGMIINSGYSITTLTNTGCFAGGGGGGGKAFYDRTAPTLPNPGNAGGGGGGGGGGR